MPEAHIVLAARDDARRHMRAQRLRQQRGEHWNVHTAYCYAVYDDQHNLVGFIRGHLSVRRMNRFRKRAKVHPDTVLRFVHLFLAAGMVS